jgi:hypothetical protein
MLELLTTSFGARAGDQIPTNEQISFTDPANSFNAFAGPYSIGTQLQVFMQEFPNGYGAFGSISAGELFLVKHQGGGVLVSGDIASPTVTRLPGVVPTGGMGSRTASTPDGLVYYSRFNGLYIWNGSNTADKISDQLEDDFIFKVSVNKLLNFSLSLVAWGDWIVTTNGYLYDTRTKSWWRLDDPSAYDIQWLSVGFFNDNLYAIPPRVNNTTKTGAIRKYNARIPRLSYSWQSHPIAESIDRVIDIREIVLHTQGHGTVTITLTGHSGAQIAETFTVNDMTQPHRLRLPTYIQGYNIVVSILSTGAGGDPAPVVYAPLRFGIRRAERAITV